MRNPFRRCNVLTPIDKGQKAMAHLATILFFSTLLIGLGVVLELIVKANWAEIVAALKGVEPDRLRPVPAQGSAAVVTVTTRSRAAA